VIRHLVKPAISENLSTQQMGKFLSDFTTKWRESLFRPEDHKIFFLIFIVQLHSLLLRT